MKLPASALALLFAVAPLFAADQPAPVQQITRLEAVADPSPAEIVELVQAYVTIGDHQQASAVLARARAVRPGDAALRTQAYRVAEAARDKSAIARLLREDARERPQPHIWRHLFTVLVELEAADEARALLAEHGADISVEAVWRVLLPNLWKLDLAKPVASLLAKAEREWDWQAALVRAELLLTESDRTAAEEALWTIFDPRCDAQPLASIEREKRARAGAPAEATPEPSLVERKARLDAVAAAGPLAFDVARPIAQARVFDIRTLQDARDLALLYLAMIAEETLRAREFVAQLAVRMESQPPAERLLAWSVVQNPEGVLREIAIQAESPRAAVLDQFCRAQIASLRSAQPGSELAARAAALAAKFPKASEEAKPAADKPDFGKRFRESNRLFVEEDFAGAEKIFRETAEAIHASGDAMAHRETVACAMSFALLVPNLKTDAAKAEGAALAVRSAFPRKLDTAPPTLDGGLLTLWPNSAPALNYRFFQPGRVTPFRIDAIGEALRPKIVYPSRTLFAWDQTGVIWTAFGNTRPLIGPQVVALLDAQAGDWPPERAIFPRAAAAYLAWWNGEAGEALARMRKLATETDRIDIRLGLAAMLMREKQAEEADRILAEAKPPYPAYQRQIKSWRLRLAAERKDAAVAAALSRGLLDAPWSFEEMRGIIAALETGECAEALALWRPRFAAEALREESPTILATLLRDLEKTDERGRVPELAKRVLATGGRSSNLGPPKDSDPRQLALKSLERAGQRETYIAGLTRENAAAPESIESLSRLAEAVPEAEALPVWNKMLDLHPDHLPAARALFRHATLDSADRRKGFERLLALSPDEVQPQQISALVPSYLRDKQLARLGTLVSEAPFRRGGSNRSSAQNHAAWRDLGRQFASMGDTESAVRLLRRLAGLVETGGTNLRAELFRQLIALGRREEAARELIAAAAPEQAALPVLFAWHGALPSAKGDAPQVAPALNLDMIKLAPSLGVAGELCSLLEKKSTSDHHAKMALLFLRVGLREAGALPEVQSFVEQFKREKVDFDWVLPLAEELSTWPAAFPVCGQLLAAYHEAMWRPDSQPPVTVARLAAKVGRHDLALQICTIGLEWARNDPAVWSAVERLRWIGDLARLLGNGELLGECAREMIKHVAPEKWHTGTSDQPPLELIDALTEAGRIKDARALLTAMQRNGAFRSLSHVAADFRVLESELALQAGNLEQATPVIWLGAGGAAKEQATLCWDLGLAEENDGGGRPVVASLKGIARPALDGQLTVELLFGEEPASMGSLARFPTSNARGVWRGTLPAAAGYGRAIITRGEHVMFSQAFFLVATENLLHLGPAPVDLQKFPATGAQSRQGGPAAGDEFLVYGSALAGETNEVVVGPRVRLKPGREYLLSAWLRPSGSGSSTLRWRCLDGNGKQINDGRPPASKSAARHWRQTTVQFTWSSDKARGRRLPANTVFLEPIVERDSSGFDLAGLSLVEIPPATVFE